MYHEYFGLSEPAFSIAVNPRYLYMSDQHKEALAHLLYGVNSGGFVLLTGEVGTGKTTIIRSLLEQIPDNTDLAMVLNPMASVPEMIAGICDELGVTYDKEALQTATASNNKVLIDSLYCYLLENHRAGRNTVLLIDEAQLLTPEALEQIRLLTNLETNTKKLLQIVLVGQPELNTVLSQPRLRQLAQRITARFHLSPLTQTETQAYISHRLQVAGLTHERNPFPKSVIKKIHRFTGGIPRRINILCERAMIGLYGHNKHQVDNSIFNAAAKEVIGHIEDGHNQLALYRPVIKTFMITLAALGAIFISYWLITNIFLSHANTPSNTSTSTKDDVVNNTATDTNINLVEHKNIPFTVPRLTDAQAILFDYLQVSHRPGTHPCWSKADNSLQCETETLDTWAALKEINRPAVLTITTADKFTAYVTLIKLNDSTATVLDALGATQKVELQVLGEKWTGRVFYLWQRPPEFTVPVSLGDNGVTVKWLAEQFALLDGQAKPLARLQYTRALQERVKIFQTQRGLKADGILGMRTVLKLNEALGIDPSLSNSEGR